MSGTARQRASERYEPYPETYGTYSSQHVATSAGLFSPWTVLKRLPDLPPDAEVSR